MFLYGEEISVDATEKEEEVKSSHTCDVCSLSSHSSDVATMKYLFSASLVGDTIVLFYGEPAAQSGSVFCDSAGCEKGVDEPSSSCCSWLLRFALARRRVPLAYDLGQRR